MDVCIVLKQQPTARNKFATVCCASASTARETMAWFGVGPAGGGSA
jgi:hypothetical protein